jgi:hypothetical protein
MTAHEWLGCTVIESPVLPENVLLLRSGDQLIAFNAETGETRSMTIASFADLITTPNRFLEAVERVTGVKPGTPKGASPAGDTR